MNDERDQSRRTSEYQKSASEVAEEKRRATAVLEEEPVGPPPPHARTKYEQTQAYAYAYLASQYLIVAVAAVGSIVAICSLNSLNKSVTAANVQASAAAAQADAAQKQVVAAQGQAAAAAREADIAQKNLEASERPWIEVIATPITPLTFDKAGGHITVKIQLINHGKSPAVNVFPENDKISGDPLWTLDYQTKCAEIREKKAPPPGLGIGVTVFPNTPYIDKAVYQLNEADILATEKKMSAISGFPCTTIEPQIFGCYVYGFGGRFYSTDFRYEMFVLAPDNPKVAREIKPEGTVPLSKLVFRTSLVGNNAY